jgi:asparagine synthase (glutamine-hydrolysing)
LPRPGVGLADAYRAYRGIFSATEAARLAAHFTGQPEAEVRAGLVPEVAELPVPASDQVSYLEITRYMRNQLLRDGDVMSMAHGLELRLPLVDPRLFDRLAGIPSALRLQPGKQLLLDAVPEIPAQVRNARKRGFSFPMRAWLEHGFGSEFRSAARGLPVGTSEWYQLWTVFALTRWLEARGGAAAGPCKLSNMGNVAC